MRRLFPALTLLIVVSCIGVALAANTTGTLKVIVRDSEGAFLRGAQVTAETVESLSKRTAITDAAGEAVLLGLDPSARYVVTTLFSGYNSGRNENVLVRTGETTTVRVEIAPGLIETVLVVARTPLVDVTTAIAGQDITLELTESLPTQRTYQGYLQLVPGVGPDAFGDPRYNNPASRSGLNYTAYGCTNGCSQDNSYGIDGINVTGIFDGTGATSFNTEAIQEQQVITGGIPAEYKGVPGLISNVVTKSGGNDYSGSVNYFFQDDSLAASTDKSDFLPDDFSSYDTAFTLGGPIKRDKVWFFASYRKLNRKDYVTNSDPGGFQRTVENDNDQYYAKVTWQMTNRDRISGTFLGDPRTSSGSANAGVANNRLFDLDAGSPRYIAKYQRVSNSGVMDFSIGEHVQEAQEDPVLRESFNQILFDRGQSYTSTDQQQGGRGFDYAWEDTNAFIDGSMEWLIDSSWGHHTIKGGFAYEDHDITDDYLLVDNVFHESLNTDLPAFIDMPVTADYLATGPFLSFVRWNVATNSDFNGLIDTIDGLPNRSEFYALLDLDADGTITMAEAGSEIVFDSTVGNPHGAINYFRQLQEQRVCQS